MQRGVEAVLGAIEGELQARQANTRVHLSTKT